LLRPVKINKLSYLIRKQNTKYSLENVSQIANMTLMIYGKNEIMQREWFEKTIKVSFEDRSFSIPDSYDLILKQLYGDYLQLPPVESRVSHHHYSAVYKK